MLVLEFALVSVSDNMLDYLVYNWYLWFVLGVGISLHFHRTTQAAATQPLKRMTTFERPAFDPMLRRGR
jgi:hypothetical protein